MIFDMLYDVNDLAFILGVNPGTVHNWIRNYPDFPSSKTGHRRASVMKLEEVHAWMDHNPKQSVWRKYRLELERYMKESDYSQNDLYGDMLTLNFKEN